MIPFTSLSTLILLPIIGGAMTFLSKRQKGSSELNSLPMGLFASIIVFLASVSVFVNFNETSSYYQMEESYNWIPSLNLFFNLGVDGVSISMILLTTFLTPLCILSCKDINKHKGTCVALFLFLESFLIGMFCAQDILSFYIFFEATLIPMFFIIGLAGGKNRIYATFKLFLYTLFGSLIMLVSIFYAYNEIGTLNLDALIAHKFTYHEQFWLFLGFFIAMAIKIPMTPVHTWLPDAHVEAPTSGSMILAGVLLKMGGYGMYRYLIPVFPEASIYFSPYIYTLSIIAIVYTALIALIQKDMKRLVAYSSISHMGMVTLGLFVGSEGALQGSLFQMISHGLTSAGMFFFVGVIYSRYKTREIKHYSGLASYAPILSAAMILLTFASIGLPGTSGFVGEFLVFVYAFQKIPVFTAIAATGLVFGAAYALWLAKRILFSKPNIENESFLKEESLTLKLHEKIILSTLCIAVVFFGLFPSPIIDIHKKSVKNMILNIEKQKIEVSK